MRESDQLRLLKGKPPRPGKRASAIARTPNIPDGLTTDEQAIWRRLVPRIVRLRTVLDVDVDGLRELVRCLARLQEAEGEVTKQGLLARTERGLVANPAVRLAARYREQFTKLAAKFGLTPADRERIRLPEPEHEPDELDRILAGPRLDTSG